MSDKSICYIWLLLAAGVLINIFVADVDLYTTFYAFLIISAIHAKSHEIKELIKGEGKC